MTAADWREYPYINVDPAVSEAWQARWESEFSHRWRLLDVRHHGSPTALLAPRDGAPYVVSFDLTTDTILALERDINDGKQLSALAGKESK